MPNGLLLTIQERLHTLPRFYSYKDVVEQVFLDDEDAFVEAWCDGTLGPDVRKAICDTMPERVMEVWLLRRVVRQLTLLLAEVRRPA